LFGSLRDFFLFLVPDGLKGKTVEIRRSPATVMGHESHWRLR